MDSPRKFEDQGPITWLEPTAISSVNWRVHEQLCL
jgi:hypothetical protein